EPAFRPDIGRAEEALRVVCDAQALLTRCGLVPHGTPAGTVMIRIARIHREDPAAHTERRLTPRLYLVRLRQGEADPAQVIQWILWSHRASCGSRNATTQSPTPNEPPPPLPSFARESTGCACVVPAARNGTTANSRCAALTLM